MVADTTITQKNTNSGSDEYQYGFSQPENYVFKSRKGIDEAVVREISYLKSEPAWMTNFRVRALKLFEAKPMPQRGGVRHSVPVAKKSTTSTSTISSTSCAPPTVTTPRGTMFPTK